MEILVCRPLGPMAWSAHYDVLANRHCDIRYNPKPVLCVSAVTRKSAEGGRETLPCGARGVTQRRLTTPLRD